MEKGWWFGVVVGLFVTFVIFMAGFYSANVLTGQAFLDIFKKTDQASPLCAGNKLVLKVGESAQTNEGRTLKLVTLIRAEATLEFDGETVLVPVGKIVVNKGDWIALDSTSGVSGIFRIGKVYGEQPQAGQVTTIPDVDIPGVRDVTTITRVACDAISPSATSADAAGAGAGGYVRAGVPGAAVPGGEGIVTKTGHDWCAQENYDFCNKVFKIPVDPDLQTSWGCNTNVTCDVNSNCWVTDEKGAINTVNIKCCNNIIG